MACDRFIRFALNKPSPEVLHRVLKDFFGEAATRVHWDKDRFFIDLVGKHSFPFRSTPELTTEARRAAHEEDRDRARWIEVWLQKGTIDVITRQADEYTNVVADGLAKMIARCWQGELEE